MNNKQFLQKLKTLADTFTFEKKELVFSPYKGVKFFYSLVFGIFAIIGFVQYDWNVHTDDAFLAAHKQSILSLSLLFATFYILIFFLFKMVSSTSLNQENKNTRNIRYTFNLVGFVNALAFLDFILKSQIPIFVFGKTMFGNMLGSWALGYCISMIFMYFYSKLCLELIEFVERKITKEKSL